MALNPAAWPAIVLADHETRVQMLAEILCLFAGLEPVSSTDGSAQWFMFGKQAAEIVDEIEKRFPPPTEPLDDPAPGHA